MTKQQSNTTIKLAVVILSMVMAVAGFVFALGAQNNKLESVCVRTGKMEERVGVLETTDATVEAKLEYIIKGMDEIKEEVKK